MSGRLEGKVALITGAGSGMGRAAAELFAGEGATVVIADVVDDAGNATAAAVRAAGGQSSYVHADVAQWTDCQAMVQCALDGYGALNVLYNNAGIFPEDDGGVLDTPESTWERVMDINLKGVWLGCRAAIPALLASGGGSIVNVASFVALMGAATAQIAYTTSKGGVLSMTRELAVEYARRGIRANALCPGPIETPLLAELLSDPTRRARRMVHIPMGRLGRAEELAKAALFLASDDSSFMTGAALVVDGGITAAYVTPDDGSDALESDRMTVRGMLTAGDLDEAIDAREIDTVLVAFPDLQGRLVGKRVTGSYWREHMNGGTEPLHTCNYLLAVDSEMNVLPGYSFANWAQGYGDMAARPDLATIRRVPWLEQTALVLCDLVAEDTGEPVEVSPRRILQRQVERASAAGYTLKFASELEFFLFRESLEEAAAKGYRDLTPHSLVIEDYHILQTTRDEYLIRAIRNGVDGAGVPVEFSKGEAGRGQHEINLVYADPIEMADRHVIYKNGAKEIASQYGRAITFMAKYSTDEVGSSCHVHSSVWSAADAPLMWDADAADHLSSTFRGWLGGQLACGEELAWMYAPTVNSYKRYQPESWAPTALAWSVDNRTCGFRVVGHGPSCRLESRIPGADVNPYLAYAATIAAGLHGLEHDVDPGPRFTGNAYADETLARVPSSIVEAINAFAGSKIAVDAFGADVHDHLLNTARQEWAYFNRAVTDWERKRNFDQW